MSSPLLTIAIPTYNRANFLDLCLQQFCKQVQECADTPIELIVSDNCSTDDTQAVIGKYRANYSWITAHRHDENIGADGNFEWCFRNANGTYLWIFGDDDLILDNKLNEIVQILKTEGPDTLFVKGYGYERDYIKEYPVKKPVVRKKRYRSFTGYRQYIANVHYNVTFASGNIINKKNLPPGIDTRRFIGSNLNHLIWVLENLIRGKKFGLLNENVMAIRVNNTGGYKLFETFGKNMNDIMTYMKEERGMPNYIRRVINYNALLSFFPPYVLAFRKNASGKFHQESPRAILSAQYRSNLWYWIFVMPLFLLPIAIGSLYNRHILYNINRVKNVFL